MSCELAAVLLAELIGACLFITAAFLVGLVPGLVVTGLMLWLAAHHGHSATPPAKDDD